MPASIRSHLTLLVIALAVPLAVLVGYNVYRDTQDAVNQAKSSLRIIATTMATNAGRKIAAARDTLERLAARPLVKAVDENRCDEVLKDLHTLNPGFSNIVYTDMQGRAVCSALPQPGGQPVNVSHTEWHRKVVAEKRFSIGKPHIGPITGKWVTVFSLPIRSDSGEMVGTINMPLDLNAYDPGIPTQYLPPDSRYGFFDADGIMIWRNEDPEKVIGTRPNAEAARRIVEVRDGEFESLAVDGVVRFFSVVPVPEVGWVAFIGVPSPSIYAKARENALVGAGISLLGLAAFVILTLALARRIEKPVQSLAAAVRAIGAGEAGVRARPSGPAELRDMATEFNAMVDARLRSEAMFREITESMREAFWIVTPDWRTVKYISPAYESIWGEPVARLYENGVHWLDAVPEEFRPALQAAIPAPETYDRCEIVQFPDYPIRRPDGAERWISARAYPVRDARGAVIHFTGIAEDITERKRAEAELERHRGRLEELVGVRTAALEQALREQESFSYSVSHDLRAPLRAINGFAEILLDSEEAVLSEEGKRLLDRIARNATRMGQLIDDILEYSRSSRLEMTVAEVDLGDLARKVAEELQTGYPDTVVEIGPLPRVKGDPTMLNQVLQNLIGNALKFSAKRETPKVEVGMSEVEGERVFHVRDNGAGFEMQYAGKLFGMFQRMHHESQFPGTGVGLAIVKRLVERHGGRVWAESLPDQGATFFFTLGKAPA
jgi:PAS domain S-box-containing protein